MSGVATYVLRDVAVGTVSRYNAVVVVAEAHGLVASEVRESVFDATLEPDRGLWPLQMVSSLKNLLN